MLTALSLPYIAGTETSLQLEKCCTGRTCLAEGLFFILKLCNPHDNLIHVFNGRTAKRDAPVNRYIPFVV
ncbi:hypothetical protein HMPREF9137_0322 [Prevotella denticola F0289]|nr:hypothetical protein HMPREF9137_0322 [Prevotella denticola F0289]